MNINIYIYDVARVYVDEIYPSKVVDFFELCELDNSMTNSRARYYG